MRLGKTVGIGYKHSLEASFAVLPDISLEVHTALLIANAREASDSSFICSRC